MKRICVVFNDHKQEMFDLVHALKMLFLYTQTEKKSVDKFTRIFKSLWDTVEALRGSSGVHTGLVNAIPRRLKMEFIYFVVLWLNTFPAKTGALGVYSPCDLLVQ